MKPMLYSFYRSSASWRIRAALTLKEIEYDYKAVDLFKGEQKSAEYLKNVNPLGVVPALIIDGVTLTESVAIMEYLEETKSGGISLLPEDPVQKAKVRQIAEIINSAIQPQQKPTPMNMVASWTGDDSKGLEWGQHYIKKGFEGLQAVLEETSGKFCVKDEVSMADICLVPQVFNAVRMKVDISEFPHIQRIYETCLKMEAFQATHPKNQPDCPEEERDKL